MHRVPRWPLPCLPLLLAASAAAAVPTLSPVPPHPRPNEVFAVDASYPGACFLRSEVHAAAGSIDITAFDSCTCVLPLYPPPVAVRSYLPPLPAGDYTVRLFHGFETPEGGSCGKVIEELARTSVVLASDGQPGFATLDPPTPTPSDPVHLTLRTECPVSWSGPLSDGRTIRLVSAPSLIRAPCTQLPTWEGSFDLGRLAAGPWSIEVLDDPDANLPGPFPPPTLVYRFAFTVSQGSQLALDGGRFLVSAHFRDAHGSSGEGVPVDLTDDSGYFWFFTPDNVEVVVKVLDGCALNGHFWVFAAGLTDVEVELVVEDTVGGEQWTGGNSLGIPFQPIQDVQALATCP